MAALVLLDQLNLAMLKLVLPTQETLVKFNTITKCPEAF